MTKLTMIFIIQLLSVAFLYAYCELLSSTPYSSEQTEESNYIQDLSRNTQPSFGILPIAEIIRRVHFPYLLYSEATTEPSEVTQNITEEQSTLYTSSATPKLSLKMSTINLLVKGEDKDVMRISYKKIIKNLIYINKFDLSTSKKRIIWNIIKKEKPINTMDQNFLENMYELIFQIPENDYIYFNINDWNVINFFGRSKLLTRRRAAIIAYALKYKYGNPIIQNVDYINELKGVICGFSQTDLKNLSSSTFKCIHHSVFANLWPCTTEQMETLLNIAQKPDVYGPYELWSDHILKTIGLLATVIKVEDFERFYTKAFNGLESDVIAAMSRDQIEWLIRKKLEPEVETLLTIYKLKINNGSSTIYFSLWCLLLQRILNKSQ